MKPAVEQRKSVKVLKFGGTCLFPEANRRRTLERIAEEEARGHRVVAVVSAMGRSGDPYATDTLERLLPHATPSRNRERDALLCCGEGIAASLLAAELNSMGIPSVSLRETQLGLSTNDRFGDAEIVTADPTWIVKYLNRDYVVVAAGFQGVGSDGSFTTLGRGGSDTTAVAIAAALRADEVLFYKDVDCLYNADPALVPDAAPLPMIPYDEAAHLAFAGAKVLHPGSANLAEREGIAIRIRSLSGRGRGTIVTTREAIRKLEPDSSELFAVTCVDGIGQLEVKPDPSRRGTDFPCRLFRSMAEAGISLDMINVLESSAYFTVPSRDVAAALETAQWAGCEARARNHCAKVSLLGGGIHGVPGIMSRILTTLDDSGIRVFQSVDTYTVISVLVEGASSPDAVRALHRSFGLAPLR